MAHAWPSQGKTLGKDSCGFGLIADLNGVHSHGLLTQAIDALVRLKHRGAVAVDNLSGDGCGISLSLPREFFRHLYPKLGEWFALGMVFLSPDEVKAEHARRLLSEQLERQGLSIFAWRKVPVDSSCCGEVAKAWLPCIEQVLVTLPLELSKQDAERLLFIARKHASSRLEHIDPHYYVCSLSVYTVIYKALVLPEHLTQFYPDLTNPHFITDFALFHQRFSTNTMPQWWLAQPFRMLAHNGEINTIQANRLAVIGKRKQLLSPLLNQLIDVNPLINLLGSDSSSLDNVLELLVRGGMPLLKAIKILIPPAWENNELMSEQAKAFHDFYALHIEPWDGPAGLVFTDGQYLACCLDRNGLRPARYSVSTEGVLILGSESGLLDIPVDQVIAKGRLGPGQILAIKRGHDADDKPLCSELLLPECVDALIYQEQPYCDWMAESAYELEERAELLRLIGKDLRPTVRRYFGVHYEEVSKVLPPLADSSNEAVASMGDDTPLAVFSEKPRSLFDYFRQQFAQVTNPAIDSLREHCMMSLRTRLGYVPSIFDDPVVAKRINLNSPILSQGQWEQLLKLKTHLSHQFLDLYYPPAMDLESALEALWQRAQAAVHRKRCLILSDRSLQLSQACIHPLIALGLINQRLNELGLRHKVSILIESGFVREPHQFACLIAFGASAIIPYLAYQLIAERVEQHSRQDIFDAALSNYRKGIEKSLLKICSKMGIATINSYRGSQLFEVIGLSDAVVKRCFRGVVSSIGGLGFQEITHLPPNEAGDGMILHNYGYLTHHVGGEFHDYHPEVVTQLIESTQKGDRRLFECYCRSVNQRKNKMLRDFLMIKSHQAPIPVVRVESEAEILTRFETAAMSLGAIAPEAHEALAVAMNRLGGRSNSGEGGEDELRYGTEKESKIKQIASARFGVTARYLVNAEVLQIKIAQGAKPGEGGQLPGKKVTPLIAKLRFSKPGITLISPPPHHDIYSIEDLAQLIFDLKQVNPHALVSVKLVAEPGVGTIAAGVAKAYADSITISGYDGGTGASPLSSIKHAGSAWELGLIEVQRALQENGLRHRVRIVVDGGLKTGLDVIKAAILGAEGFGFGTAPLIALGCKYLRICHLNNCATGIATQDASLRKHYFHGTVGNVMRYFTWVAEDIRNLLAQLGYERLEELIGCTELLAFNESKRVNFKKLKSSNHSNSARFCSEPNNPSFDKALFASELLCSVKQKLHKKKPLKRIYSIKNYHRSIGANVAGYLVSFYEERQLQSMRIELNFQGTAGQSFGVWNCSGLHLTLSGDANDYVGKGMSGGSIIIHHPEGAMYCNDEKTVVAGNTCLYGATGGEAFFGGSVGERFAVRNSGAVAVVEGVGDHGCEYMTGGFIVILGETGINFAAGMTGGIALVFDEGGGFSRRYNPELIRVERLDGQQHRTQCQRLHQLIKRHYTKTKSIKAKGILDDFAQKLENFWLILPKESE